MLEKGARRLGVATETTGVVSDCATWEPPSRWAFWEDRKTDGGKESWTLKIQEVEAVGIWCGRSFRGHDEVSTGSTADGEVHPWIRSCLSNWTVLVWAAEQYFVVSSHLNVTQLVVLFLFLGIVIQILKIIHWSCCEQFHVGTNRFSSFLKSFIPCSNCVAESWISENTCKNMTGQWEYFSLFPFRN